MSVTPPPTILVVEDESSIASFVSLYLRNAGYAVRTAATGSEALSEAAANAPALVVLDLMLPDIDGLEVCKRLRQGSDVPILMLTARDEDVDKIIGLEVGADDYLTKPFNPRELVARIKSILRRATPERNARESEVLEHGDLRVDAGRHEVHVGDEEIQLAPKEFDLLWELLDHRGLVLTATSSSSGSGGTRSRATRARSTSTSGSSGGSWETPPPSLPCWGWATRSRRRRTRRETLRAPKPCSRRSASDCR